MASQRYHGSATVCPAGWRAASGWSVGMASRSRWIGIAVRTQHQPSGHPQFLSRQRAPDWLKVVPEAKPRWLVTCSCGWARECISDWAAESVSKLHPQLGDVGVDHKTHEAADRPVTRADDASGHRGLSSPASLVLGARRPVGWLPVGSALGMGGQFSQPSARPRGPSGRSSGSLDASGLGGKGYAARVADRA